MKIAEVEITNVGIIEHLVIRPQSVTVISGGNGQGKTTVLEAIRACFEGGHDPSLIRRGAKKADVLITLDNKTTIRRTITPKSSDLDITTVDGLKVPKPQSFVEKIAAGFSFDPIAFMDAPKKDRAAFLLSAMPVKFTPADIDSATKLRVSPQDKKELNLDDLAAIRKQLYETRSAKNKIADESTKTCFRLHKELPQDDGIDWKAKQVELQQERDALRKDNSDIRDAISKRTYDLLANDTAEINRQILELTEKRDRFKAEMATALNGAIAELEESSRPRIEELSRKIVEAEQKAETRMKLASTRETIDKMADEALAVEKQVGTLTKAIESIDELKARKLALLPIDGLVVESGEIFFNGVPWDRLSTAQKYFLCFQVIGLKAEPGSPMIVDRGETFDAENWDAFESGARESGFQIFATKVTAGPMKVEAA
jgi:predicted ATP-dependent endonuclease of OLD family